MFSILILLVSQWEDETDVLLGEAANKNMYT